MVLSRLDEVQDGQLIHAFGGRYTVQSIEWCLIGRQYVVTFTNGGSANYPADSVVTVCV